MMERRRALDSEGYEMESDLISASSGGSMSDYGSDLEDIELELLRDKTRAHVIIRDTDRNNHYRCFILNTIVINDCELSRLISYQCTE